MSADRPTRRQLIGAAAAATLLAPGEALASALEPRVFSEPIGRLDRRSGELLSRWPFVLAGIEWSGPRAARIEFRARSRAGVWSPWSGASSLGHEPDGAAASARSFGSPVWFGPSRAFQLQTSEPVERVRVHFVSVAAVTGAGAAIATAYPLAQPVLDAGAGQPPIIARAAWAGSHAPPAVRPGYGAVRLAFVHHTDNPNGYSASAVPAILLAMYQFHRFVRGWDDLGYNFVIDLFGRIWEARAGGIDQAVVGAQAGGYNQESTGISVLGTFSSVVPSRAAIAALERLLAWKLSLHGVPAVGHVTVTVNRSDAFYTPFAPGAHVSLNRIAGHRDGDSTDCPGNAFYARLPSIRPRVAGLAGTPARITLAADATAIAGTAVNCSGRLRTLAGSPLGGATLELQALQWRGGAAGSLTLTSVTTDSAGRFVAPVALSHNTQLRALHRDPPATVSTLVAVGVAPAITAGVQPGTPPRASGTVMPAKRHVSVAVYAQRGAHRRGVALVRARVHGGRFATPLRGLRPGAYVLVVRSAADATNIAGQSVPVQFTV